MRHLLGAALVAVLILPGFGGQGPMHSGRCRGEALPRILPAQPVATCTRAGWRVTGTAHHGG